MKILYGVQGTGNGHITRARAMAEAFKAKSEQASVDYVFSGRAKEKYFDMDPFGDFRALSGLSFKHKDGKIDVPGTLTNNNLIALAKDIYGINVQDYDVILSDFEPVVAWAGKKRGKTVIGVGHQFAFQYPVPMAGDSAMSRMIIRRFAPVNLGLGLHWHHFGYPILPPIADTNATVEPKPNKVLVYLGFEEPSKVIEMLEPITDHEFYYYGEFNAPESRGHIHLRPLSRDGFKRDLEDTNAVLCNAGFELASEAIEMGKKLLMKPLYGQMEQLSNAAALEQLGLGREMKHLDTAAVRDWLAHQPNVRVHYPNVAQGIVDWLLAGDWTPQSRQQLVDTLWQQVHSDDIDNFSGYGSGHSLQKQAKG